MPISIPAPSRGWFPELPTQTSNKIVHFSNKLCEPNPGDNADGISPLLPRPSHPKIDFKIQLVYPFLSSCCLTSKHFDKDQGNALLPQGSGVQHLSQLVLVPSLTWPGSVSHVCFLPSSASSLPAQALRQRFNISGQPHFLLTQPQVQVETQSFLLRLTQISAGGILSHRPFVGWTPSTFSCHHSRNQMK